MSEYKGLTHWDIEKINMYGELESKYEHDSDEYLCPFCLSKYADALYKQDGCIIGCDNCVDKEFLV